MKQFFIFLLAFTFMDCKEVETTQFTIYFFDKGSYQELKSDKSSEIFSVAEKIIKATDDMLRLRVTEERIKTIKKNDRGLEIIFKQQIRVTSQKMGVYNINKILIPFDGEFVGNDSSPVVTVFLGNNGYFTGPLRNKNGYGLVKEIMKLMKLGE